MSSLFPAVATASPEEVEEFQKTAVPGRYEDENGVVEYWRSGDKILVERVVLHSNQATLVGLIKSCIR